MFGCVQGRAQLQVGRLLVLVAITAGHFGRFGGLDDAVFVVHGGHLRRGFGASGVALKWHRDRHMICGAHYVVRYVHGSGIGGGGGRGGSNLQASRGLCGHLLAFAANRCHRRKLQQWISGFVTRAQGKLPATVVLEDLVAGDVVAQLAGVDFNGTGLNRFEHLQCIPHHKGGK